MEASKLMLEAQFGEEDEDEGEPFLEPADPNLQLGQGWGQVAGCSLPALSKLSCGPAHKPQQGACKVATRLEGCWGCASRLHSVPLSHYD